MAHSEAEPGPYIVCVDDDPSLLQLFAAITRLGLGAQVATATSAAAAQALLSSGPRPDLILVDYTMPGMTGLQLITWARAQPGLETVPMIIFTAVDSLAETTARAAGATAYFVKPLPPRTLIARLREFLPRP